MDYTVDVCYVVVVVGYPIVGVVAVIDDVIVNDASSSYPSSCVIVHNIGM